MIDMGPLWGDDDRLSMVNAQAARALFEAGMEPGAAVTFSRMVFVKVRHPDIEQEPEVPLSSLDHYRQKGWRPVDPEYMTPTEMVEQRVEDLQREQALWVEP